HSLRNGRPGSRIHDTQTPSPVHTFRGLCMGMDHFTCLRFYGAGCVAFTIARGGSLAGSVCTSHGHPPFPQEEERRCSLRLVDIDIDSTHHWTECLGGCEYVAGALRPGGS